MPTEFLDKLSAFEKRNNVSIVLNLCSDGSGTITEFWQEDELESFETLGELAFILENVNYRKDETGLSIKPVERI